MIKDKGKYHENMYRFLVSSRREGKIRTRMYIKDGVMLECQKEIVNLVKDPNAQETDVWDCKFRVGESEVKAKLRFDDMCSRFFSMSLRSKLSKS